MNLSDLLKKQRIKPVLERSLRVLAFIGILMMIYNEDEMSAQA